MYIKNHTQCRSDKNQYWVGIWNAANTNQLSWLFSRFITMILKMECLVPIHSQFSTKWKSQITTPKNHRFLWKHPEQMVLFFPLKIMESMVPLLLNINRAKINDYLWNQIPAQNITPTFITTKGVLVPQAISLDFQNVR